jgi:hypothetical protein
MLGSIARISLTLLLTQAAALGQLGGAPPSEYDVKAAFLLNFTKFVEWPDTARSADSPFTLCILGDDPFGPTLDQMVAGERVNQRRLAVRKIRELPNSCDMLFISKSERVSAKVLADAGPGVLTVGETEDFLRNGGMIAFVVENRRVRFDIDQRTAVKAGLKISSKLLNVARSVEKDRP